MRVRLIVVVLSVCALVAVGWVRAIAAAGSTGATAAAAGVSPTRLIDTRPVDTSSEPRTGLKITVAARRGTCEAGSDSVGDAYRCGAGNVIYDPCWADETPGRAPSVLCQSAPWQHAVVRIRLSAGLGPFLSGPAPRQVRFPWGVQLSDGTRCLAAQGAHGIAFGKTIEYGCAHSPLVLLGAMAMQGGVGRFTTATSQKSGASFAHGPTVTVRTAWYAIPDDGDQLASRQGRCTAPALAYAAQLGLSEHERITAGSTLVRFACDGQYALARRTTYTSSVGTLLLFQDGGLGWAQIAEGTIQPGSGGVPPAVLQTLGSRLAAAGAVSITY